MKADQAFKFEFTQQQLYSKHNSSKNNQNTHFALMLSSAIYAFDLNSITSWKSQDFGEIDW